MSLRAILAILSSTFALPAAASAEGLAITHSAPPCVPAERYLRLTATGAPGDAVASAELQFRGGGDGDWYAARMTRADGAWSAYLPRARRGTPRVEYRIVMTRADAETAATPVHALAVEGECAASETAVEVAAPIVVRVPAGAPPVPPVPPGFNPAGVVAAEPPAPRDKWRAARWVGGAAAAVGLGALAAGTSKVEEAPPTPMFGIAGLTPNPGSSISQMHDRIVIDVDVSGEPAEPLTFTWVFGLRPRGRLEACVTMSDVAAIGPDRPLRIRLTAPLRVTGFCGVTFNVDTAKLTIVVNGHVAREITLDVPFRFIP